MSEVITNPGYYAIIPASVRYDERVCPNAKLLFGEITALTNSKGYCWATNDYFAKLYSVNRKTISRWVQQLVSAGHLKSNIRFKKNTKQVEKRQLKICTPIYRIVDTPPQNSGEGMDKIMDTPIHKIVEENNTSKNITINNTINSIGSAGTSAKKDTFLFNECRHYWLTEVHAGWSFDGSQGKALKSLISKLKASLKNAGNDVTDNSTLDAFKILMQALPEWFRDKELNVINSKYNEIINQIKNSKNGTTNNKRANAYTNSIFA